jgi:ferredoxin
MERITTLLLSLLGLAVFLVLASFAAVSAREREWRAARTAALLALALGSACWAVLLFPPLVRAVFLGVVAALVLSAATTMMVAGPRIATGPDTPVRQVDERDIMFARARLRPGSAEYDTYYEMRPENRAGDDLTRSKPGLLAPAAQAADPLLFACANACFDLTEALRDRVDGPLASARIQLPPASMAAFVKSLARYFGALDVGISRLQPYHVYSHVGRGTGSYGEPVKLDHAWAIAFTVQMDFAMIGSNPAAPGVMESGRQYVESARTALLLANTLRRLGHPARAHIDGNYRVIAPLVARDAGLGEIGRMGLLMTPQYGPRVRLGIVTTDLELVPDSRKADPSVVDFCRTCSKCAENCPSRSIPLGERQEIDGALRWRINADTCYRYWCVIGTDCGVCMTVCPYSHPATGLHRGVRWAVARSTLARRAAYRLDDLFYGRRPAAKEPPRWTGAKTER